VLASLTRGGLDAATRSLAIEYAQRGIRVNAVALGVIKSPMHPVEQHDMLGDLHPIGHMGEMADVVDAILYLENAPFVTGEILHVDGGQRRPLSLCTPRDPLSGQGVWVVEVGASTYLETDPAHGRLG
jgi:NAD(P)-dependent dehydrogenase (short-subunit alcohol dehydrogenase family)